MIEVSVPASKAGTKRDLARVSVGYDNMVTGKRHSLRDALGVQFTGSKKAVAKRENRDVMVAAAEAVATRRNREAVALRDQGKVKEAQKVLVDNANELRRKSKRYRSKRLKKSSEVNFEDSMNLDEGNWGKRRKIMRKTQHSNDTNQSY